MAVVIQEMVPATSVGVLFTVNPITGVGDEMVINATWGLGEALVGGQVTPDTITVEKSTGRVKQFIVGDKSVMTVLIDNGTREQEVDTPRRQEAVLSSEEIAQLTTLGCEIEQFFGTPQDIEWAIADQHIFVLQSRPITSHALVETAIRRQEDYNVPGDDSWDRPEVPPPQPFDLWTRTNLGENFPFPVSPLSSTAWPALFIQGELSKRDANAAPPAGVGRRFYGRLYINEGSLVHTFTDLGLPTSFLDTVWGSSGRGLRPSDDTFHPLRFLSRLPSLIGQGVKMARQQSKKPKQPKKRTPKLTTEQLFNQIDQWVSDFQAQDLSQLDDRALWAQGIPVWGERAKLLTRALLAGTLAATAFYFLERRVNRWTGSKDAATKLVMALSGIYTAEIGPGLWQMAQTLRAAGLDTLVLEHTSEEALVRLQQMPEAATFLEQFEAFLQQFGYRCPNDAELLNPRWIDAPEQVITLLEGYLHADERVNPEVSQQHQRAVREETTAQVEARLNPFRRAIFRWLLKNTQKGVRARDNYRSYVTKFLYPMRKLFAKLGRRWMERGWLDRQDDIFFLTVSDIDEIIATDDPLALKKDLHTVVADRRAAFDFWRHVIPADAIGPDGTPVVIQQADKSYLQGVAASGGRARGTARLVRSVGEARRLTAGDILVTSATDPGWTPVFPLVSGLVLEIGGQLSHGAIIAREYGVPAVINVSGAMQSIRDGQVIVVDGTHGRVYLDEVL